MTLTELQDKRDAKIDFVISREKLVERFPDETDYREDIRLGYRELDRLQIQICKHP